MYSSFMINAQVRTWKHIDAHIYHVLHYAVAAY